MDPTEIVAILREEWDRVVRPGADGPPDAASASKSNRKTANDEGDAA